jgi:hypothetical protein
MRRALIVDYLNRMGEYCALLQLLYKVMEEGPGGYEGGGQKGQGGGL